MADNVIANTSDGLGASFATDEISGGPTGAGAFHYPLNKVVFGSLNSATLVDASNGLPVAQQGTWNIATVTSLTQMNGQAIAMGTGLRSAGTQRVTIATDDVVPASQSGTWNIGTVTTVSTVTSLTQMNGAAISMNTGVRDAGTQRVTIATNDVVPASQSGTWTVQPGNTANTTAWLVTGTGGTFPATQSGTWTVQPGNTANTTPWLVTAGHGKTHKPKTGSASATFTVVAAVGGKKIKVYGLSLMTSSTTAVTVTFKDGVGGTALATYTLQAISGTVQGIVENVNIPSQILETTAGNALEMAFSVAQTVTYNLRYFDDDAS